MWLEEALYFCTGPEERKARNLERNRRCVLTTGRNELDDGFDRVVEGEATRVGDETELGRVAAAYESKYGVDWRFEVRDGAFVHGGSGGGGVALVFRVAPQTVLGFRKGSSFSQTRWRF